MAKKQNFCVIDTETLGLSARPESFVLGCVYGNDGLFKKHFLDREEMVKWIFNQDEFKYVFAHNAEYDFTCLFDNIFQNLDREALFVGSMFIKAKKDRIVFMNSLAILKTSVLELGKYYGIEKLQLDDKFKNAKPGDKIVVNSEDIKYCHRDCEIIYDYLKRVFEFTGKMKPTIASCAMEIFTKNYLVRELEINPFHAKFRESYYGGRVECFKFGKIKDIYKYDINSLYPYVCTDMYFPDFNKMKRGKIVNVNKFISHDLTLYEGCALVDITHKEDFIGILPYRTKTEIIYPCGTFSGWYNFNELRSAVSTGLVKILKVKEFYYAPKIFFTELRDYMKFFYEKKNTTEGSEKLIFKFILNALTGKFAQREHGKKVYCKTMEEAVRYVANKQIPKDKYRYIHFSSDREDCFIEYFKTDREIKRSFSKWNIPTISSYITSQARITMIPFFLKYKEHLVYTDTDSLVLTCPIDEKYVGSGLGKFKKEKEDEINVIGNKHYYSKAGEQEFKYIKGVHKNHTTKDGKFYFNRMIRSKEGLRRVDELTGVFIEVEKTLSENYTKRTKHKNTTKALVYKNNSKT